MHVGGCAYFFKNIILVLRISVLYVLFLYFERCIKFHLVLSNTTQKFTVYAFFSNPLNKLKICHIFEEKYMVLFCVTLCCYLLKKHLEMLRGFLGTFHQA